MNLRLILLSGVYLASLGRTASAQGTFQNLDFEAATIIPIPGDPLGRVQFAPAFPGWTGYFGTNQVTQALYNNKSGAAASIDILDANTGFIPPVPIFQGQYVAAVQAGAYPTTDNHVPTTIAQSGLVPASAHSLQFKAHLYYESDFEVSLGGQVVNMSIIELTSTYRVYGGDISQLAGQVAELRITALPTRYPNFLTLILDDIQFSNQPIPEPSTIGLFAFGALLLGWRLRKSSVCGREKSGRQAIAPGL